MRVPTALLPAAKLMLAVRPARVQAEWVATVKKNLETEAEVLKLEAECAALRSQ